MKPRRDGRVVEQFDALPMVSKVNTGKLVARSITFGGYSWKEGQLVIPSLRDGGTRVNVWNLGADSPHVVHGHTSFVYPVAISSDGGTVVSGSWGETARVWDGETGAARFICGGFRPR